MRLIETVKDSSGTVVSNNEFSVNLFTTFQPQNTGEYILNITNAGARNVTIYGIFGHMPVLTAASTFAEGGGRPELFQDPRQPLSPPRGYGAVTAPASPHATSAEACLAALGAERLVAYLTLPRYRSGVVALMLDANPIAFYGRDRAVVTSGNSRGNPIEFIRDEAGGVGWIRYIGRIARKTP